MKTVEEDIIFGRLPPGTRLVEDTLMERFGATRHFVRQALYELERRGVVVREKNKGAAVRSLTPQEVEEIYDVRELLQRQAALRIALPASAELVARLTKIQAAYRGAVAASRFRAAHELNDEFHLALFGGSGNDYLVDSVRSYMQLSLLVRAKTMADPTTLQRSVAQHDVMIELLKGRDAWALAQLCVEHIQPAKTAYLSEAAASPSQLRAIRGP
jgi:DNA-binding GntR family transcriptional regulator